MQALLKKDMSVLVSTRMTTMSIVVLALLSIASLFLHPASAQSTTSATLANERCTMEQRVDIEPSPGLPPDQQLQCEGVLLGSVSAYPLRSKKNAEPISTLIASYRSSPAAQTLRGKMTCRLNDAKPLVWPGAASAAGIPCTLANGGWPQLLLLVEKNKLVFITEGPPVTLPVLLSHVDTRYKLSEDQSKSWLATIFGESLSIISAADMARLRNALADARTANARGHYLIAELLLRDVLAAQSRQLRDTDTAIANTLLDLALSVSNQNRDEEAQGLFRRAEIIIQQSTQEVDRARLATYQGYHAANMGRFDEALRFASAAASSWRKITTGPNLSFVSINGGAPSDDPQKLEKGELAMALNLQASMALRVEEVALAQAAASEALAILVNTRGLPRAWRADVMLTLGKISSAQGRLSAAEQYLNSALAERKLASGEGPQLLPILAALGRAYQREGMNTSSIITYRDIFASIKALPAGTENPLGKEDMIPFAIAVTAVADTLTDEQQKQGLFNEAFDAFGLLRPDIVEQTIARASARLAISDAELSELVNRVQATERARDTANLELSFETSLPDSQRSKTIEDQLTEKKQSTEKELLELRTQLTTRFPDYVSLSTPKPLSTLALRERLGVAEGIVSFIVGREASFVQLVRRDGIWIARIPQGSEAIAESVAALRSAVDTQNSALRDFDMTLSHRLYHTLLGGVQDKLSDLKHLVVIPSGPLSSLPFSVLIEQAPTPGSYVNAAWLNQRLSISHSPSLRAFYLQRSTAPAAKPERAMLAFGNPSLSGKSNTSARAASGALSALASSCRGDGPASGDMLRALAPLPETAEELSIVQRSFGGNGRVTRLYLGDEATEARLREEKLDAYRVLYFATHGLLPGELKCQAEPGLVLTPPRDTKDRRNDGLLETSEIASLRLNADLVVLSACNTAGSGSRFGGDALSGLAESFFHAGARRLVVSHWQVPSKATAALMSGMFEALGSELAEGPAHALRDAQRKLIRNEATAHPFYWAAFVVIGDGQSEAELPLPRGALARN
jgi:CHAT domain-containing protein